MVILHVKRSDLNQFLYETNTGIPVADLLAQLVRMNNLRSKLDRACQGMEDLASKGPMRPEELRGLDNLDEYVQAEDLTVINGLKKMPPRVGTREVRDETNYRTGVLVSEELTNQMLEEAMKGKQLIHKTQVDRKVNLTFEAIDQQLDIFKGLVMMAYPGYHGLGEWEPIRDMLESPEADVFDHQECLEEAKTSLWIVSKELQAPKLFSDYFGKNEKQKFVAKLQSRGAGAPQREPVVDQETHKAMLAYYHKKQEEHKKMEEDNEDQYMNSMWADNRNLKA